MNVSAYKCRITAGNKAQFGGSTSTLGSALSASDLRVFSSRRYSYNFATNPNSRASSAAHSFRSCNVGITFNATGEVYQEENDDHDILHARHNNLYKSESLNSLPDSVRNSYLSLFAV